jgi:hypothetical protein
MAAEREDRRAQLVRGVRDELSARPFERREALAHVVEGVGELAELVPPAVDDRLLELSARDAVDRALQTPDAPREQASEAEADRCGRQERSEPGENQPPLDKRDRLERVVDRGHYERDADPAEWNRHLAEPRAVSCDHAALHAPMLRRALCHRIALQ